MADGSDGKRSDEAHVHHGKVAKVDRYKWVRSGERGELRWIAPSLIRFDEAYQRTANEGKIKAIAAGFSWPAFGVVTVGERADGTLWGIDGQHRTMAARRRADVAEIPVVVFRLTEAEEASAFLGANTLRKPLNGHDKYKAGVVTKDPATLLVDDLIRQANRIPAHSQSLRSVCCLRGLVALAGGPEKDTLVKLWPLITEITMGVPLTALHVDPLVYMERHGSESLTSPRWTKRLLAMGPAGIVTAAQKAAAYHARGGARVWATGVVAVMNKSLREDRYFALRDSKSAQTSTDDGRPSA